jgi:hypothetical protein
VPFLNGEAVEEFIDLKSLREAITGAPVDRLTDNDRTNVFLLQKAIDQQAHGKPYSKIQLNDSEL